MAVLSRFLRGLQRIALATFVAVSVMFSANSAFAATCRSVSPGYYCSTSGSSGVATPCPAGCYCPGGTNVTSVAGPACSSTSNYGSNLGGGVFRCPSGYTSSKARAVAATDCYSGSGGSCTSVRYGISVANGSTASGSPWTPSGGGSYYTYYGGVRTPSATSAICQLTSVTCNANYTAVSYANSVSGLQSKSYSSITVGNAAVAISGSGTQSGTNSSNMGLFNNEFYFTLNDATRVYGNALCSADMGLSGKVAVSAPSTTAGQYCWCQLTHYYEPSSTYSQTAVSGYMYLGDKSTASGCSNDCAESCRLALIGTTTTSRQYRSNLIASTKGDAYCAPSKYQITFNNNDGSGTTSTGYVRYGYSGLYSSSSVTNTTTKSVPIPTRAGYKFDGWYTAASGGSFVYYSNGSLRSSALSGYTNSSGQWVTTQARTLYAHWIPLSTITLNRGYGNNEYLYEDFGYFYLNNTGTLTYDERDDLFTDYDYTYPTITGFGFAGYYSPTCDEYIIDHHGEYQQNQCLDEDVDDAETLYADYTPTIYHVTLNNQDATTAGATDVYYKYTGAASACQSWCSANMNSDYDCSYMCGNSPTYNYYRTNSFSSGNQYGSNGYTMDSAYKPTKTGYTFGGYYSGQNCSGTRYIRADGVFVNDLRLQTNISTLYACWTPNTYTLTFSNTGADSGTFSGNSSVTCTYGQTCTGPGRGNMVKAGYMFAGWNTTNNSTYCNYTSCIVYAYNYDGTTVNNGATIAMVPTWYQTYTVTLNRAPGTGGTSTFYLSSHSEDVCSDSACLNQKVDYFDWTSGSDTLSLSAPSRTGYTFGGYEYNGNLMLDTNMAPVNDNNQWWYPFNELFDDLTLNAVWTPNVYTITLNTNNSNFNLTKTNGQTALYTKYNTGVYTTENDATNGTSAITTSTNITLPTMDGWTFYGYYNTNGSGGTQYMYKNGSYARMYSSAINTAKAYTSNQTWYARWSKYCEPGTYYPGNYSSTCTTCPAGSYCPGITVYNHNAGTEQGMYSCSDFGSGLTSPAGATSAGACYKTGTIICQATNPVTVANSAQINYATPGGVPCKQYPEYDDDEGDYTSTLSSCIPDMGVCDVTSVTCNPGYDLHTNTTLADNITLGSFNDYSEFEPNGQLEYDSSSAALRDGKTNGEYETFFDNVSVRGYAKCSSSASSLSGSGQYCWCKTTKYKSGNTWYTAMSDWMYAKNMVQNGSYYSSNEAYCQDECSYICSYSLLGDDDAPETSRTDLFDTAITYTCEPHTYNVTYSCGDGTATDTLPTANPVYNTSFTTAAASLCTKTGYTFAGWAVSDTSDVKSADSAFTWTYTEDKTLTAQWTLAAIHCDPGYYLPAGATECSMCDSYDKYCPGNNYTYNANNDQGVFDCPSVTNTTGAMKTSLGGGIGATPTTQTECAAIFSYSYDPSVAGTIYGMTFETVAGYTPSNNMNKDVTLMGVYCMYNAQTQLYDRCQILYHLYTPLFCKSGYYVPQNNMPPVLQNVDDNLGTVTSSPCVPVPAGSYTKFYDIITNIEDHPYETFADKIGIAIYQSGNSVSYYSPGDFQSPLSYSDFVASCPAKYPESDAGSWQVAQCYANVTFNANGGTFASATGGTLNSSNTIATYAMPFDGSTSMSNYSSYDSLVVDADDYNITTFPTLNTRNGYTFRGWYDNDQFSGSPITSSDGLSGNKTLYARWLAPIHCNAGEYLPAGAESCSSCDDGYYCPGGDYQYDANNDGGKNDCPEVSNNFGALVEGGSSGGNRSSVSQCAMNMYAISPSLLSIVVGIEPNSEQAIAAGYNANAPINQNVAEAMLLCLYNTSTEKYDICKYYLAACANGAYVPTLPNYQTNDLYSGGVQMTSSTPSICTTGQSGYYTTIYDTYKNDEDNADNADKIGVAFTFSGGGDGENNITYSYMDLFSGNAKPLNEQYKACPVQYPESAAGSWKVEQCYANVTFDANGGTFGQNNDTTVVQTKAFDGETSVSNGNLVVTANNYSISAPYIERTGYTLDGWNTAANGSGDTLNGNSTYSGNQTFYAQWTLDTYPIHYMLKGGTNNANNPSTYTVEDVPVTLSAPTKAHATFAGWCNYDLYGSTSCSANQTLTINSLYDQYVGANWTCDTGYSAIDLPAANVIPTVEYRSISENGNTSTNGASLQPGEFTLAYTTGSIQGVMRGNTKCTNIQPSSAELNDLGTIYNNTINDNTPSGNSCWMKMTNWTPSGGSAQTLSDYWIYFGTSDNCADTCSSEANRAKLNPDGWNADLYRAAAFDHLYECTPNTYTITYNTNGGTNPANPTTSYTIESSTITLPIPTKTGYTFDGWYDNSGLTGTAITTIATGSTGNKEYWAKWTQNVYNIMYKSNGGAVSIPNSYQVLEYIEGLDNTQYIDTGIVPNPNMSMYVKFSIAQSNENYSYIPLGARDTTYNGITLFVNPFNTHTMSADWFGGTTNTRRWSNDFSNYTMGDIIEYSVVNNNATFKSGATTLTHQFTPVSTTTQSMYLNAVNHAGAPSTSQNTWTGRIYRFTITGVADMIPVKRVSDNAVGMYDLVRNEFYGNAGTGAFTAGAATGDVIVQYSTLNLPISTLPTPTKNGYVFNNWKDSSNNTVTSFPAGTTGNKELTAQWTQCVCTNGTGATCGAVSTNNNQCVYTWACTDGYAYADKTYTTNNTAYTASCTECVAGTYATGDATECTVCAADTYSASAHSSACVSCAAGYTTRGSDYTYHAGVASCKITCDGGYYVATNNALCTAVGSDGYTNPSAYTNGSKTISQGTNNASDKILCQNGEKTAGYGAGADDPYDCGHILHITTKGANNEDIDNWVHLKSHKYATPSLAVEFTHNGVARTYYGRMSLASENAYQMNTSGGIGTGKKLKIKYNNSDYTVFDDLIESGYTPVEYLQSSGAQYIDTGIVANQDTSVLLDGQFTSGYGIIFGARTDAAVNVYTVQKLAAGKWIMGYNTDITNLSTADNNRHVWFKDKNKQYIDNVLVHTATYANFTTVGNVGLFGFNKNGEQVSTPNGVTRVYSCKMYNNGTLVRDFIPVKDNAGRPALYDTVNKQFYYNQGSGADFTAGPVVSSFSISSDGSSQGGVETNDDTEEEIVYPTIITLSGEEVTCVNLDALDVGYCYPSDSCFQTNSCFYRKVGRKWSDLENNN